MTSKVNGDGQFNPIIPAPPLPLASPLPSSPNLERLTLVLLPRNPGAEATEAQSASSTGRRHRDEYK
jgi:hypothetical protein